MQERAAPSTQRGEEGSMSGFDLKYYADVFATIDSIYQQELLRPADLPGLVNWFCHVRENGRTGEWVREQIRLSPEYAEVHKPRPNLPRLVTRGSVFALETGARFTAIECSDFNLFGRYLSEGVDTVRTILQERAALGFNMLRVWSEYQGNAQFTVEIGRLVPSEHDFYFLQLGEFFDLCADYGFYVELTVFTGTGIAGHWERVGAVAQEHGNALLELANEVGAHPSINPSDYQPIPGVLCSHGSNGSQAIPVRPAWDYETFHTNDAFEWWRKGGHNGMELSAGAEGIQGSGKPILANENTRPDRDGNINHHHDAAAACALLIAGSCFHAQSGKRSALFGSDRPFAEAFVRGAKSVNLAYQDGRYFREDPGTDLRVYSRINPDGSRHTVRIRR
jgi:hypothetical protein